MADKNNSGFPNDLGPRPYATAKYFALIEVGIPADRVRIVIVHQRNHVEDHMVVAIYQDDRWLILDDLTLALVQDTDESEYTPLFVLDNHGVRLFQPHTRSAVFGTATIP